MNLRKLKRLLLRDEEILQDWPNLARYRAANRALPPPEAGEDRVVFMGDSITDAWGPKFPKLFEGKPYIGRGIGGQTTPQMLIRFRPDALALHPTAVVILGGTNDIAANTGPMTLEDIENNLQSMAELAAASGVRVILCSVLPVCDYHMPQTDRRPPETIVALNEWIKGYCEKTGAIYVDYWSAMIDDQKMLRKEWTGDGLHPNDAGYRAMSPLVQAAIEKALNGR